MHLFICICSTDKTKKVLVTIIHVYYNCKKGPHPPIPEQKRFFNVKLKQLCVKVINHELRLSLARHHCSSPVYQKTHTVIRGTLTLTLILTTTSTHSKIPKKKQKNAHGK